jgi:lactoylglutathione lyase
MSLSWRLQPYGVAVGNFDRLQNRMPLYETHLPVGDLDTSVAFYRDIVGLIPAFRQPERGVAFLWIEGPTVGMLGLWQPGALWGWRPGQKHLCHFALSVALDMLFASIPRLKSLGVEPIGFGGDPVEEPSVIGWMPSAQIYFKDPDGHTVEFITVLPHEPEPSFLGTWSEWEGRRKEKTDVPSVADDQPNRVGLE